MTLYAIWENEFDPVEWDKNATAQSAFLWKSDDPASANYGVIEGYTSEIQNYSVVKVPSRCTKLIHNESRISYGDQTTRSFTANIQKIMLPDTVTEIGRMAFGRTSPNGYSFSKVTEITLPNGVTTIGESAFVNCTGITSVTIPNSVTSIGSSAFSGCTGLTSITIPDSVTSIGESAFKDTPWLTAKRESSEKGLVIVNGFLIDGNAASGNVTIPEGITTIHSYAFYGCTTVTSITIPDSLTSIGDLAFYNCANLTSITFKGTTYTDKSAFKQYLISNGIYPNSGIPVWQ